jgi:hypothetical protein
MGIGKKLAIGVLCLLPAIALAVAAWAFLQPGTEYENLFTAMILLGGLLDFAVAAWFIPHVHDNPRVGQWRVVWIVLLGIPFITVAPIYWAIYVLPEKPGDRQAAQAASSGGGAWYADPWGEAPYRWWDGDRWTDWVTGPPPR